MLSFLISQLAKDPSSVARQLRVQPNEEEEENEEGKNFGTPLHIAVSLGRDDCVRAVVAADPLCAAEPTPAEKRLPLHCIGPLTSAAVIEALLAAYPAAAAGKDSDGRTPLHSAVINGASAGAVEALLAGCPSKEAAAAAADGEGNTPLHFLGKDSAIGVAAALLRACPAAATVKGGADQGLPLHSAVERNAPRDVIALLLEANPSAARTADRDGALPLHVLGKNSSAEVARLLFDAHPDAIRCADKNGDLPLHLAVFNGAPPEVVSLLLAANPAAARVADHLGELPIHSLTAETRAGVVKLLHEAYPEGVEQAVTGKPERWPLHVAARASADIMSAVLRASPGVLLNSRAAAASLFDLDKGSALPVVRELVRRLLQPRAPRGDREAAAALLLASASLKEQLDLNWVVSIAILHCMCLRQQVFVHQVLMLWSALLLLFVRVAQIVAFLNFRSWLSSSGCAARTGETC